MSDEAPAKKDEGSGAPAWVMTFADLMSLLMCFFVLLLSFSEMDLLKFKQIAGSMKRAFGIQREIEADDIPKGTSIIAQEFSPGRPTPTVLNEIRQSTIDNTRPALEFTDAMTEGKERESINPDGEYDGSGGEPMQRHPVKELVQIIEESDDNFMSSWRGKEDAEKIAGQNETAEEKAEKKQNTSIAKVKEEEVQTVTDAYKLLKILEPEIAHGLIAIKTQGSRILLRINEKGSFPSGSSIIKSSFLPVLNKLRKSLKDVEGRIVVAGHTDNIPIKTARFRSNWELSASRAVTVVHELLLFDSIPPDRFVIEGHGDAHPMLPNDTAKNRELNRRVKITIVQGDDGDKMSEVSAAPGSPFVDEFGSNDVPKHASSIQQILDQKLAPSDQSEIDAIDLQTLKDRFELIRKDLKNQ